MPTENEKRKSGITCKGAYALNTACGNCARCDVDPLNPKNAPNPHPAMPMTPLEKIEDIVSQAWIEDAVFDIYKKRTIGQRTARQAIEALLKVYRISHSYNNHPCRNVHEDWRNE